MRLRRPREEPRPGPRSSGTIRDDDDVADWRAESDLPLMTDGSAIGALARRDADLVARDVLQRVRAACRREHRSVLHGTHDEQPVSPINLALPVVIESIGPPAMLNNTAPSFAFGVTSTAFNAPGFGTGGGVVSMVPPHALAMAGPAMQAMLRET